MGCKIDLMEGATKRDRKDKLSGWELPGSEDSCETVVCLMMVGFSECSKISG
jgi:hypothetical protein